MNEWQSSFLQIGGHSHKSVGILLYTPVHTELALAADSKGRGGSDPNKGSYNF